MFPVTGDVAHVDVLKNQDGRSKGCAVVFFDRPEDAEKAIGTPTAMSPLTSSEWELRTNLCLFIGPLSLSSTT